MKKRLLVLYGLFMLSIAAGAIYLGVENDLHPIWTHMIAAGAGGLIVVLNSKVHGPIQINFGSRFEDDEDD